MPQTVLLKVVLFSQFFRLPSFQDKVFIYLSGFHSNWKIETHFLTITKIRCQTQIYKTCLPSIILYMSIAFFIEIYWLFTWCNNTVLYIYIRCIYLTLVLECVLVIIIRDTWSGRWLAYHIPTAMQYYYYFYVHLDQGFPTFQLVTF